MDPPDSAKVLALDKRGAYYAHDRSKFLEWVGGRYERVLDLGCGSGANAPWYREHGATEVVGVEIDEESAVAAGRAFDRVICAPIEDAVRQLAGPFDLIVCADVLEHLVDPWTVVRELTRLSHGVTVLAASIPNIRFLPAVTHIALGRGFKYTSEGIFDITHLRFFTRPDIASMLVHGGWTPTAWSAAVYGPLARARRTIGVMTRGRSDQWLAEQLFVRAGLTPRDGETPQRA